MNIFHPGNKYIYLSHYSYVQMNSCIHEFRYSQIEVQLFMQLFTNVTIHVHALAHGNGRSGLLDPAMVKSVNAALDVKILTEEVCVTQMETAGGREGGFGSD